MPAFAGDSSLSVGADNYSATTWTNLGTAATNSTYTQAGRNLVDLTGSPQKIYLRTPGGAAMGAVTFGGSDGIWATKGSFGIITNNRTVIAIARIRNAAPQGFLFDGTSTTPGYTRALVWSNNWQVSASSSAGSITAPVTTNVWQVHSFVVSTNAGNSTFSHFTNGVLAGSATVGLPGYLSGLMIGANVSQAQRHLGGRGGISRVQFRARRRHAHERGKLSFEQMDRRVADTNAPAAAHGVSSTPVFVSGTGYPEYRIPAWSRRRMAP